MKSTLRTKYLAAAAIFLILALATASQASFSLADSTSASNGVQALSGDPIDAATAIDPVTPILPVIEPETHVLVGPNACWHVRPASGGEYSFVYGNPGDVALLGDWDGDGFDTPGMYRPSNGFVYLSNVLPRNGGVGLADPDLTFFFGMAGDKVFVGDWDGDGIDTLGIMRQGRMYLANRNATVAADQEFWFGELEDIPYGGDPDGDGTDGIILYRPSTGFVYYSAAIPRQGAPLAGTDGDYFFGNPNDRFTAGDWDGDGSDTGGVFRSITSSMYLSNALRTAPADFVDELGWGTWDWNPVAGHLNLRPGPAPETDCGQVLSPLTGSGRVNLEQQVVIAKFSNARKGRPQEGINLADMVMEVIVEGGVGRWMAFYQTELPSTVGPLRSIREVDPKLIKPFDARVLTSGGPANVRDLVAAVASYEGDGTIPGYFRQGWRPSVYDLMYDIERLPDNPWEGALSPVWTFDPNVPTGGQPANEVTISMSRANLPVWTYDPLSGSYLRSQDGRALNDVAGERITADTLVIVYVDEFDTGRRDAAGAIVPDYTVTGVGTAAVIRDGRAYPGSWVRSANDDHFTLLDWAGNELPMKPGRTWLHVTPSTGSASWN